MVFGLTRWRGPMRPDQSFDGLFVQALEIRGSVWLILTQQETVVGPMCDRREELIAVFDRSAAGMPLGVICHQGIGHVRSRIQVQAPVVHRVPYRPSGVRRITGGFARFFRHQGGVRYFLQREAAAGIGIIIDELQQLDPLEPGQGTQGYRYGVGGSSQAGILGLQQIPFGSIGQIHQGILQGVDKLRIRIGDRRAEIVAHPGRNFHCCNRHTLGSCSIEHVLVASVSKNIVMRPIRCIDRDQALYSHRRNGFVCSVITVTKNVGSKSQRITQS